MQNKGKLRIHEDSLGNIYVAGATEIKVSSEEEVICAFTLYIYDCTIIILSMIVRNVNVQ